MSVSFEHFRPLRQPRLVTIVGAVQLSDDIFFHALNSDAIPTKINEVQRSKETSIRLTKLRRVNGSVFIPHPTTWISSTIHIRTSLRDTMVIILGRSQRFGSNNVGASATPDYTFSYVEGIWTEEAATHSGPGGSRSLPRSSSSSRRAKRPCTCNIFSTACYSGPCAI